MTKVKVLFALIATLFAALFAVGCQRSTSVADERIYIALENDAGYVYDKDTKSFLVEYGNSFAVPEGLVYDKKGDVIDDYYVDFTLFNDAGEEILTSDAYLTLGIGRYSIVFSAQDSGSSAKDLEFSLTVEDPKAPDILITSFFVNAGLKDSVIELPTFRAYDTSGVDSSATEVSVKFCGEPVTVTDNKFVADKVGTYTYEVYLKDALGNDATHVIPIEITERYVDASASGFTLMTFDSADYEKSVKTLYGTSEGVSVTFAADMPAAANGVVPSDKGIRVTAPDDATTNFLFVNNKELNVYDDTVGNIVIRIYVEDLLEKVTVRSADGKKIYKEFLFVTQGWNELAFSARSCIGWYDGFSDLTIGIYNEDAGGFYIDELFYTEQWYDTDIADGYVADFDEAEYLTLVTANQYNKTQEFTHIAEGATDIDEADAAVLAGANGGILKIVQKGNLDGFDVSLCFPVETSRLVGLRIRMCFSENENLPENSRWGFTTNDGYVTTAGWNSWYGGCTGRIEAGWKDYYFTGPDIRNRIKTADSDLITAFWFGAYDTENNHTYYIDEIEVMYLDETVETDVPGQFEFDEEHEEGVLADFSDERYVKNVITSLLWTNGSSQDGNVKGYSYDSFNDGEKQVYALKVEPNGNYSGTNLTAEGVEYVLPSTISVRNTDGTPKAEEIVVRAYFMTSFDANVALSVRFETGYFPSSGVNSVPACFKQRVTAGWNEFKISVKSIVMLGAKGITSIAFVTRYDPALVGDAAYYIGGITFTEYIPPYNDPDYLQEISDGELLLASFDTEEYVNNVSVSTYGSTTQPRGLAVKEMEIDGDTYGVVELKPTASSGYNGFDCYLPKTLSLKPKRTPIGNYIYIKLYTPVAMENAFLNVGFIKEDGNYSDSGQYVKPQRLFKSLSAGWNVVKVSLSGVVGENVTNIVAISVAVRPVYGSGVADSDKVLYFDSITVDAYFDTAREPLYLEKTVISASMSGNDLVLSWTDVANATAMTCSFDGVAVQTSGNTYRVANFASDSDHVFSVTATNGEYSSVAKWVYDGDYGKRTGDTFIIADFDRADYADAFRPVDSEPDNVRTSLSEFYYDSGLIMSANGKSNSGVVKSGFVYYFPFAIENLKKLYISASNIRVAGSSASNWGIGQYADTYLGVITEDGTHYCVSAYTTVAGVKGTSKYINYYNSIEPVYTVDVTALCAALENDGETLGNVIGVYYGQNKEAIIRINYIRYIDGDFSSDPVVNWTKEAGNYVVRWSEVSCAESYEVTVDGVLTSAGVSGRSITLTEAGKVVGIKAKGRAGYYDSNEVTVYLDPSYMSKKDESHTYLSDMNGAGADKQFRNVKIDPNGNSTDGNGIVLNHGTVSGNYTSTVTGVKLSTGTTWTFDAAEYVLPVSFDLASAEGYLFVKLYSANWNNPSNLFVLFRSGDGVCNVFPEAHYAVNDDYDNEDAATGSAKRGMTSWSGSAGATYAIILAWDMSELIETDGWKEAFGDSTSIDGIIIGLGIPNYTIAVDEIYFGKAMTLNEKYAFSATSGTPSGTSWSANGTGTAAIVADANASDGYALKITHNKTYNFYIQLSEEVVLDEYSSIIIRYKTTSAATYLYASDASGQGINVNSTAGGAVSTGADGEYVEVDILSAMKEKTTTLGKLDTWCNDASGGDIYIDCIIFTKKQG